MLSGVLTATTSVEHAKLTDCDDVDSDSEAARSKVRQGLGTTRRPLPYIRGATFALRLGVATAFAPLHLLCDNMTSVHMPTS